MQRPDVVSLFGLTLVAFAVGCGAMSFSRLSPHPNVMVLGQEGTGIALRFGDGLPDEMVEQSGAGCRPIAVTEWHGSLEDGFESAFSDGFASTHADNGYVLTLREATPSLRPTAVDASGRTAACAFRIRYKAVLQHPDGSQQAKTGEAQAKQQAGARPEDLASAIEVMYEEIAEAFFPSH